MEGGIFISHEALMFTTSHRRGPILAMAIVAALVLVITPFGPLTAPALADSGMEASFVAKANAERAAHGLPALSAQSSLVATARSWSSAMAGRSTLSHNPDLASQVSGWQAVGENVGRGPSVDAIHAALMASPSHRANILDPRWSQIGIGVVVQDGTVWVTQVFRQPAGTSSASSSADQGSSSAEQGSSGNSSASTTAAGASKDERSSASPASSGSQKTSGSASSGGSSTPSPAPPQPAGNNRDDASPPSNDSEADDAHSEAEDLEPQHEVIDRPLPMDRLILKLARIEASERAVHVGDVLAVDG